MSRRNIPLVPLVISTLVKMSQQYASVEDDWSSFELPDDIKEFVKNDLNSINEGVKEDISPEARSDYDYLTNHQPSYDNSIPSDFYNNPGLDSMHTLGGLGDLNLEKEGRQLGLLGGGLGLGGYGQLQLVYYIRILYIRLLYLMRLLQYSNCGGYGLGGLGGAGGVGGGFSNYFSGGYRRSDLGDLGQLTDKRMDLNLSPPPPDYDQGYN